MKKQNSILMWLKLKNLALHRYSFISRLIMETIEKMDGEETRYEEAHNRQLVLMQKGIDLRFQKSDGRDSLHER